MAIYKIKRFSFKDKFKGAMKGSIEGAKKVAFLSFPTVAFGTMLGSPKPAIAAALGVEALGALSGAYNGWNDAKNKENKKLAEEIEVNEPTNLNQLFQKYPKLRELDPLIKHRKELEQISIDMDRYRLIVDWEDLDLYLAKDLDLDSPYPDPEWFWTKSLRADLNSQEWIACIGEVCYNTRDNNFYILEFHKRRVVTIKEYGNYLVECIENAVNNELDDISPIKKKVAQEDIKKLKKIFNL